MAAHQAQAGTGPAVLIDSNVFIAAEEHGGNGHLFGASAAELLRLVQQLGYRLVLSSGTRADLLKTTGERHRRSQNALQKYHVLDQVPLAMAVREVFPLQLRSNDRADLEVLSTFATHAAKWLVTDDTRMRKRAARAGLTGVLSLDEALEMFRPLARVQLEAPAAVRVPGYAVNYRAALFDTLRQDYDFDHWWQTKVAPEHRDTIVIGQPGDPEGVAVLKTEEDRPHGLPRPVLKVCTFKVADDFRGSKRGELLLKAVVEYARRKRLGCLYLEVLPTKTDLLIWLEGFGFTRADGAVLADGACVMVKHLLPPPGAQPLSPLEHAVAYGPGSVLVEGAHVVPIKSHWHHRLLPEADRQGDLFQGLEGCGNAIKKAYLCHANTRRVVPGDVLLFLRTHAGPSEVTAVGVVEQTLVSAVPEEVIEAVGSRTVYTAEEIAVMCERGDILILRFRLDRTLDEPWKSTTIQAAGLLTGPPQTITEVKREGVEWIRDRLAGSP